MQIDGWAYPLPSDPWIDLEGSATESVDIVLRPLIELKSPVNQKEISSDEVTFAWEEVKGAAYYDVHLGIDIDGGSISSPFKNRIKGTKLTVPIDQLYDKKVGYTFEGEGWSTVDPVSIMAFTNTENRFSWSVKAFDSEGEMITQSNGYRLEEETIGNLPFFYLKERKMSEADRLLLNKNIDKAYQKYKEDYEKNPEGADSLRMLSRLKGWENEVKGEKTSDNYGQKWAEISTSPDDAHDMAQFFGDRRDWENYQLWHERYLEREGVPSDYVLGTHATMLMKQGKSREAQIVFHEAMELDPGNRFIGSWLALELYEGSSFEETEALAEKYPERSFAGERKNWANLVRGMSGEAEGDRSYRHQLQQVLELYWEGEEKELEEWLNTADKERLKEFMHTVREVS
jgi:tetratricopeptide (TPR) repeat protein